MEEFQIGLSGTLLVDETVVNIENSLKDVSKGLKHSLEWLQIEGYLDYKSTLGNIQDALNISSTIINNNYTHQ